jgi:3-oxoacyl-[acyl-carrier-protein] synthase II
MVSYSSLNEAFDLFGVETENGTMALNLERALKRANINFSEVDYISAHGNGILPYDISETEAIKQVFGEMAYNIPVSSIKPVTAHSISATGIFQIIASLLAIRKGIVPPTINVEKPDPKCDLDYVRNGYLKKKIQTALINAHGFGGRLTVIIIRQFPFEKSIA